MDGTHTLLAALAGCDRVIAYRALADETDAAEWWSSAKAGPLFVPRDKTADPLAWAAHCKAVCGAAQVAVLLPGRNFDRAGTRHGRGGGWYDRFLQAAPEEWLRIGITVPARFSAAPLARQPWDLPVDWVAVKTGAHWEVHRTGARGR